MAKRCKQCRESFTPVRPLQVVCSPACAIELQRVKGRKALEQAARQERKKLREAKEKLKTRSDWAREAQAAFNAYIRGRDHNQPCISCGTTQAKWDAGHYRSRGAAPELAYNEDNCHKQCAQCNSFRAGNVVEYRIRLIKRIGLEKVEWLEGKHEPVKLTIDDLKEIKNTYKQKLKDLKHENL